MGVSAQLVIPTTHTQDRRKVWKYKGRQIVIQLIFKEKVLLLFLSKNMGVPPLPHPVPTALNYIYEKKCRGGQAYLYLLTWAMFRHFLKYREVTKSSLTYEPRMGRKIERRKTRKEKTWLDIYRIFSHSNYHTILWIVFSGPISSNLAKSAKSSQNFRSIPKMQHSLHI